MGFLKTETYPLIYSSSDIPGGKLPGDIISILSFDITILYSHLYPTIYELLHLQQIP